MNKAKNFIKTLNPRFWVGAVTCCFYNRQYWVFRLLTPEYDDNGKVVKTKATFEQHFVEPFNTRYEAKKAIKENGELFQPWQKFVILSS